jgi:hypothetical protein
MLKEPGAQAVLKSKNSIKSRSNRAFRNKFKAIIPPLYTAPEQAKNGPTGADHDKREHRSPSLVGLASNGKAF